MAAFRAAASRFLANTATAWLLRGAWLARCRGGDAGRPAAALAGRRRDHARRGGGIMAKWFGVAGMGA